MLKVKSLFLYPVKSFAGHAVSSLTVGPRGPLWDRQWMIIDKENQFVTQRTLPKMSQITAQVVEDARVELHAPGIDFMDFGVDEGTDTEAFKVKIWESTCDAQEVEPKTTKTNTTAPAKKAITRRTSR